MAEIVWDERLSVGIASIDAQHKQLVMLTNKLYRAIKAATAASILMEVVLELAELAESHFALEEGTMKALNYPELQAHIEEHDRLRKETQGFVNAMREGNGVVGLEIFNFLRDWLVNHLIRVDMLYKPYFEAHGVT